ncbi:MAG TPA: TIGR03086 family metal-binding protein [Acidimicrobiales bacterium]|jgi:uncharacterized protein (TIGR03086 family)|nr:TIGR03086 family metal-binding protein [Acidimicrobiales bacterium]
MIDLEPATIRMAHLLTSISDAQLERPTPCPDTSLGDLVDHVSALTIGFSAVARKAGDLSGSPPRPNAANLEPDWRDRIARDLDVLAQAWRDAGAWQGTTMAAGVPLPGEIAGLVALDELVVHGWDIAVSTGQTYAPSLTEIEAAASFVTSFDAPRDGSLFGPIVPVADNATPLDRLLGLTGRDPAWQPPTE